MRSQFGLWCYMINVVTVQAGAGLVADSDPEKEYEETLNKARGLLEAIRCLR